MTKTITRLLSTALLMLTVANAAIAADAGTVTFANGAVTAERQPAAALAKGDAVLVEDFVITGAASRAQLLMLDGAKLAIRPNSRLQIEEYAYPAAAPTSASSVVTTSGDNSSVISLVKGGFRTITGAIGKEDPSDYEVRTAVGVLGIRGTNFAVLLCSGDCNNAPGVPAGTIVPDGLYIMVSEGSIFFSNELANIDVSAGQFVFIPFETREPTRLDTTPAVFINMDDLRFEPEGDGSPSGFDEKLGTRRVPDPKTTAPQSTDQNNSDRPEVPRQSIEGFDTDGTAIDLTPGAAPAPGNRTIGFSMAPLGQGDDAWSGAQENDPSQYQLDGNNNVTGFDNSFPFASVAGAASFDIGTSSNVESGFDTVTVLRWGRWAGGTVGITLSDGTDESQNIDSQSLHWISSAEGSTPVMPVSGRADYSLVGSTTPTDSLGNTGVLGSATFSADFTNMVVDSFLSIDINGSTWTAAGQGGIGEAAQLPAHLFLGNYDAVAIDGITVGTGIFSGFFSAPGPTSDPTFPGGAGLTYSLEDGRTGTGVSGAAAFGNP